MARITNHVEATGGYYKGNFRSGYGYQLQDLAYHLIYCPVCKFRFTAIFGSTFLSLNSGPTKCVF